MTGWEPATEAEIAMRDALRAGDQEQYFRILARTGLLLPVSADALAGRAPMGWGTWTTSGRTHVLAFTSDEALQACLAEHAGSARRLAYHELAAGWPNLEWWLAVNPGLPIEGYLPAWFVAQLARGDTRLPGKAREGASARATAAVPGRLEDPAAFGPPPSGAAPFGAFGAPPAAPPPATVVPGYAGAVPGAGSAQVSPAPPDPGGPARGMSPIGAQLPPSPPSGQPSVQRPEGLPRRPGSPPPPDAGSGGSWNAFPASPPPTVSPVSGGPPASRPAASSLASAFPSRSAERTAAGSAPAGGLAWSPPPSAPAVSGAPGALATPAWPGPAAPAPPAPATAARGQGTLPVREPGVAARALAGRDAAPPAEPGPADSRPAEPGPAEPGPADSGPAEPTPPATTAPTAADPAPAVTSLDPSFRPANEVEEALLTAAGDGSTDTFLSTLLLARVLIPLPDDAAESALPGDEKFAWRAEVMDGEQYVVVFTSDERLREHVTEPVRTASVKFIQLIRAWPDPSWSFAVNPGTPVGATLPGSQIVALASWAADVGLGVDAELHADVAAAGAAASAQEAQRAARAAGEDSSRPTVMQKVVPPAHVEYYLERGYDRVSGFVHRASEVAHLRTPDKLVAALGLRHSGSPFDPNPGEVYVLRWPAFRPSLYRIPYGGQTEAAMRAMEGWVIERPPFRGNGFAPGDSSDVVAEFKVDSARLPHGAQLWRVRADGSEKLVAILDADRPVWRRVGED